MGMDQVSNQMTIRESRKWYDDAKSKQLDTLMDVDIYDKVDDPKTLFRKSGSMKYIPGNRKVGDCGLDAMTQSFG